MLKKHSKQIILTIAGISLLLLAQFAVLDDAGLEHTEEGLKRALITYGISRSLNGVISVVQGTEIAVEPVGIGMTFTPGQILDPVNDLIEQFSTVVLVSGTAFGIQRMFLEIIATPIFSIVCWFIVVSCLCLIWSGRRVSRSIRQPVYRIAIVFLIIRFSVPALAIVSEQFYQTFLAPQFEASSQQLRSTTEQLEDLQSETEPNVTATEEEGTKSFLDSARELYRSATSTLDVRQHIEDFTNAAESISEHAIRLIVIFIFQTILLPLASIWIIVASIKWVMTRLYAATN